MRVIHPTGIFSSLEVVSIFNWHNRIYRTDNDFPCGIIFLEPMSKVDYVLRRIATIATLLWTMSFIVNWPLPNFHTTVFEGPWQSAQTGYRWWKLLYLIQRLSVSVQRGNACSFSAGNNSTLALLLIESFIVMNC